MQFRRAYQTNIMRQRKVILLPSILLLIGGLALLFWLFSLFVTVSGTIDAETVVFIGDGKLAILKGTSIPQLIAPERFTFSKGSEDLPSAMWRSVFTIGRFEHRFGLVTAEVPIFLGAILLLGIGGILRFFLEGNRNEPGDCESCGYDLRGCSSDRCPECGQFLNREEIGGNANYAPDELTRQGLGESEEDLALNGQHSQDSIALRLGELESRVKRTRNRLVYLTCIVLLVIVWIGLNRSGPVANPRPLLIQDDAGRVLLDIAQYSDDSYGLSLRRPTGGSLAALFAKNDNPELGMFDTRDKTRLSIHLKDNENSPEILLFDSAESVRATLSLRPDQTPVLSFFDDKQKNRMAIGLGKNGWPELGVFDEMERCRFVVYVTLQGRPAIDVFSEDGKEKQSFLWCAEKDQGVFKLAN